MYTEYIKSAPLNASTYFQHCIVAPWFDLIDAPEAMANQCQQVRDVSGTARRNYTYQP